MTDSIATASVLPILVTREDAVGVIVLNRPDKRNALDLTMRAAIAAAIVELEQDDAIRVIVRVRGWCAALAWGFH